MCVVDRLIKIAQIGGWRLVIEMQKSKASQESLLKSRNLRYVPGDNFLYLDYFCDF